MHRTHPRDRNNPQTQNQQKTYYLRLHFDLTLSKTRLLKNSACEPQITVLGQNHNRIPPKIDRPHNKEDL